MIEFSDVGLRYGNGPEVLHDLSFSIEPGSFHFLTGPSGAGKTSLLSRSNDTWIATKVRTRMMANRDVPSDQVKIVAENGTVYLMGLISEMEGDNAANVARNVSGVSRVVKVFEYIN